HGACLPKPGLRGEVRLSLRRLRRRPAEGLDSQSPAGAAGTITRGRARDGPARAGRDRPRSLAAPLVDPYANEWLDLLVRWLHVIAAIAWIGSSFYFIALDNHLRPPKDPRDSDEGVGGEAWEVHGGGFYHVHKYRVAPPKLPEELLWFKWEAYTTWLSGFALLIVLYYVNADTYLIDKGVADLSQWEAIAISVAMLAAAWIAYDALCRVLGRNELLLA